MFAKHGLRSAARMPGKTALTFLLVLLVAALLGTSLGLTWSVRRTLDDCKKRYTTLAVPEYNTGEDETDPEELARVADALARVELPDGVLSWEPSRVAQGILPDMEYVVNFENARSLAVLLVKVRSAGGYLPWEDGDMTHDVDMDDGVTYHVSDWQDAQAIVSSALFSYADVEGHNIAITEEWHDGEMLGKLEPDHYYLVCGSWEASWAANKRLVLDKSLPPLQVDDPGDLSGSDCAPYLQRAQATEYLMHSVTVRAGNHLADQIPFQQQTVYLEQGRMFTAEEESSGAEVCVVSSWLAKQNGWQLGDKVHLCIAARENSQVLASYDPADGFDKDGEYTVVGTFSSNAEWNATVFIPTPHDVDMTVNHCDAVLGQWKLRNGSGNDFLAGCEGILPAGVRLRLYDQGYSATAQPLETMLRIVGLISLVCLAAGIGFLLLTAWLYVSRQKQVGSLMVRLGASPWNVITYYLSGLTAIAVPAAVLGAVVSALVSRLVAGVMNNILADTARRSLSYSADKLMLQEDHAVTIGAAGPPVYAAIAIAVVLVLLIIGAWFAQGTVPRQRPRTVRRRRQSRVKTRSLTGGAAKYALLSTARGGFRTAVAVLAPMLAAVLLCLLVSSVESSRTQLDALRHESTVRGYFTDWSGSQLSNTPAKTTDFLAVLDMEETVSGTATQVIDTWKQVGRYDPETDTTYWESEPEDYGGKRLTEAEKTFLSGETLYLPQIIAASRLTDAPQFAYTGAPEVMWLEGWDEGFLATDCTVRNEWVEYTDEEIAANPAWQHFEEEYGFRPGNMVVHAVPCVASTAFLESHKLALGDECMIMTGGQNPMTWRLEIVGSYKKAAGRDNIYVPIYHYLNFSLDKREGPGYERLFRDVPFETEDGYHGFMERYDPQLKSAVFTFRCDDLDALKQRFRDMGLSQVRQLDANRKPFLLEDGVFQASQQSLQQRLWYMERIFPVVAGLTEAVALVLGFLLALSRRKELWLMHCMGTSGIRSFGSIYLEQIALCLAGGAVGLAACRALSIWNGTGLWQTGLFAALWLLGTLIAVLVGVLRPDRREG